MKKTKKKKSKTLPEKPQFHGSEISATGRTRKEQNYLDDLAWTDRQGRHPSQKSSIW